MSAKSDNTWQGNLDTSLHIELLFFFFLARWLLYVRRSNYQRRSISTTWEQRIPKAKPAGTSSKDRRSASTVEDFILPGTASAFESWRLRQAHVAYQRRPPHFEVHRGSSGSRTTSLIRSPTPALSLDWTATMASKLPLLRDLG